MEKGKQEQMKPRFIHIVTSFGGATLAYRKLGADPDRFEIGVAYCSPTEPNFSKKKGRLIAQGRLNAGRNGNISFARKISSGPDTLSQNEIFHALEQLRPRPYAHKENSAGPRWWSDFITVVKDRIQASGTVR